MRVVFTPNGWEDYTHRVGADRTTLKRVNRLIQEILRDPFAGIGKPEQLRHALAGAWSRRITDAHRLVYLVDGDDVVILQAGTRSSSGVGWE
ncbi:MAG: Txe/YoeB family addiction module toxin [Candidatus Dormibacteria bacterium]